LFERLKTFFIVQTTISNVEFCCSSFKIRCSSFEIVVWTIKNGFYRSNNNFKRWISLFNVSSCCLNDEKRFFIVQTTVSTVYFHCPSFEIVVWTIKNVFNRSNNNFKRWISLFNIQVRSGHDPKKNDPRIIFDLKNNPWSAIRIISLICDPNIFSIWSEPLRINL